MRRSAAEPLRLEPGCGCAGRAMPAVLRAQPCFNNMRSITRPTQPRLGSNAGVTVQKGTNFTKTFSVGGPGSDVVVTTSPSTPKVRFRVRTSAGCYITRTITLNVQVRGMAGKHVRGATGVLCALSRTRLRARRGPALLGARRRPCPCLLSPSVERPRAQSRRIPRCGPGARWPCLSEGTRRIRAWGLLRLLAFWQPTSQQGKGCWEAMQVIEHVAADQGCTPPSRPHADCQSDLRHWQPTVWHAHLHM